MTKPLVDILIEGFSDETNLSRGRARYRPTISLVRVENETIIVDPGTVERQQDIVDALANHGVGVGDVTLVIHTHHHLDHNRNTGMFPDIPVLDWWALWRGVDYSNSDSLELSEHIRIAKTPGHTYDSLTVYVETTAGLVAICGDVIAWENDETFDYAQDVETLKKSREVVLAKSDVIIPGHGPLFTVNS